MAIKPKRASAKKSTPKAKVVLPPIKVEVQSFWREVKKGGQHFQVIGFKNDRKSPQVRLYPVSIDGESVMGAAPVLRPAYVFGHELVPHQPARRTESPTEGERRLPRVHNVDVNSLLVAAATSGKSDDELAVDFNTTPQTIRRLIDENASKELQAARAQARRLDRSTFTRAIRATFAGSSKHTDEIERMRQSAMTPLAFVVPESIPGTRRENPRVGQMVPWNRKAAPEEIVAMVRGDKKAKRAPMSFEAVGEHFDIRPERVRQVVKEHDPALAAERAKASRAAAGARRRADNAAAKAPKAKKAAVKAKPAPRKPSKKVDAKRKVKRKQGR